MDFTKQCIDIAVTQGFLIPDFAVRAEIADAFAERDMDVQPQILTFRIGEGLIIFILEGKGLP
jgi:hypothetical protein